MGTWGHEAFENDAAHDWLAELEDGGIDVLRDALQPRARDEYIEVDDAQNAVAAAEIVAVARGQGVDGLPDEVAAWLAAHRTAITDEDVMLAHKAVTRVRESSELQELFADEYGDDNDWTRSTASLLQRLSRSR